MLVASTYNILAKTEWKVPAHIVLPFSEVMDDILSFISFAALLVKVRDRIVEGSIPWSIR